MNELTLIESVKLGGGGGGGGGGCLYTLTPWLILIRCELATIKERSKDLKTITLIGSEYTNRCTVTATGSAHVH